jgi:Tol biopolymer transport system component
MPEVQEVFRMATQKVKPDPGAMERQLRGQRRRTARRKAGVYGLVAALVIVAAVVAATTLPQNDEGMPGDRSVVPPVTVLPGDTFFLDLRTGEKTPLAENQQGGTPSPDGTKLAYSTGHEGGCGTIDVLTVANVDGTDAQTIEAPNGLTICGPRWSPDSTKLVYQAISSASSDGDVGNLFVHDLASGRKTQLTHLGPSRAPPGRYFLSPIFSADGRDVYFHLPRNSSETTKFDVWSVPVAGGEPTLVVRNAALPVPLHSFPDEVPETPEIAFVSPTASDFTGRDISTADLDYQIRRTLVDANTSIWWPTLSPDGTRIAYHDGGSIYVVELSTAESRKVAEGSTGSTAEWLDIDTLIVSAS